MAPVENTTQTMEITAEAHQTAGWWTAQASDHDLPPATARSLASVTSQLRKIAAAVTETPVESIKVTVNTDLPSHVQALVDRSREQQATAEAAKQEATQTLREAAQQLKAEGWPDRDIAAQLHMSTKTIAEVTRAASTTQDTPEDNQTPEDTDA